MAHLLIDASNSIIELEEKYEAKIEVIRKKITELEEGLTAEGIEAEEMNKITDKITKQQEKIDDLVLERESKITKEQEKYGKMIEKEFGKTEKEVELEMKKYTN